jgi:hypothetical protein
MGALFNGYNANVLVQNLAYVAMVLQLVEQFQENLEFLLEVITPL